MPRRDGVVPVAVEGMALNVEGSHFGIADFDAFGIAALVDVASDGETGIGSSGADQLNNDLVADEQFAAPVLGDMGKEVVLDAVPFAGAGRQMGDGYNEAGFVGKALELTLPEADAGAVAAAAISRYGQGSSLGIAFLAEPLPPAANAMTSRSKAWVRWRHTASMTLPPTRGGSMSGSMPIPPNLPSRAFAAGGNGSARNAIPRLEP